MIARALSFLVLAAGAAVAAVARDAAEGASPAQAGAPVAVPSGQSVWLLEWLEEPGAAGDAATDGAGAPVWRLRFLAPAIGTPQAPDFDAIADDMAALCTAFAVPRLRAGGDGGPPAPVRVIVSLSDRPVPFGETAPEATQYFEVFSLENGACVWEGL